jgi:hypothetical protein
MTENFEEWIRSELERELAPASRLRPEPASARYQRIGVSTSRIPLVARAVAAVAPALTLKTAVALACTGAVVAGTGAAVHIAAEHHVISVPSGIPLIAPDIHKTNETESQPANGTNAAGAIHRHASDKDANKSGEHDNTSKERNPAHHPSSSPTQESEDRAHHATPTPGTSHDSSESGDHH